jgi:putative phage-type endonuclease
VVSALAVRQGTPAWLEARRSLVTASDIPVLLGVSPFKCEADLADEKRGLAETESTLRMRVGLALEDLIAAEYEAKTGHKTRRWTGLAIHPQYDWAGASPDRRRKGALVEFKHTTSRSRFADGLPQDVEGQIVWQEGVTGIHHADVAVLTGDDLLVFEHDFDAALFDDLVAVAQDFRRRLTEGGPFKRDTARIKRDYPADDGSEMLADPDLTAAVKALVDLRTQRKRMEDSEAVIEDAIKARMGPVARLTGDGFTVTWRKTKDVTTTDWKALSDGLLRQLPEEQREPLIGLHSAVREGFRPFRVVVASKED